MSLKPEKLAKNGKRKRVVDAGEWDCARCTFKNDAESSKCLMCEAQRGTSTRRGVGNPSYHLVQQELEVLTKTRRQRRSRGEARGTSGTHESPSSPSPSISASHRTSESPYHFSTDASSASVTSPGSSVLTEPASSAAFSYYSPKVSSSSRRSDESSSNYVIPSPTLSSTTLPLKTHRKRKTKFNAQASKSVESVAEPRLGGSQKGPEMPSGPFAVFTIIHDGVKLDFEELVLSDMGENSDEDDD